MGKRFGRVRERVRGFELVRRESERVPLFNELQLGKWRTWSWNEQVSLSRGERMVEAGKAERITRQVDGFVQVVGYRLLRTDRPHRCSPTTLTLGTMERVANAVAGDKRDEQHALVVKFHVWQDVPETFRDAAGNFVPAGVYKSPTVRPRVTLEEHKRAWGLLKIKIEPKAADVVTMPMTILAAAKPLAVRTAAEALAAAGSRLGMKPVRAVGVAVA